MYGCKMSMDMMNLTKEDLVEGAEVLGAMEFMELAEEPGEGEVLDPAVADTQPGLVGVLGADLHERVVDPDEPVLIVRSPGRVNLMVHMAGRQHLPVQSD